MGLLQKMWQEPESEQRIHNINETLKTEVVEDKWQIRHDNSDRVTVIVMLPAWFTGWVMVLRLWVLHVLLIKQIKICIIYSESNRKQVNLHSVIRVIPYFYALASAFLQLLYFLRKKIFWLLTKPIWKEFNDFLIGVIFFRLRHSIGLLYLLGLLVNWSTTQCLYSSVLLRNQWIERIFHPKNMGPWFLSTKNRFLVFQYQSWTASVLLLFLA